MMTILSRRSTLAAALALWAGLLAAAPARAADAANAASLAAQVRAAYAAYDAAFNTGRPDAVAATYAQDAVFLPPDHTVIKGRPAIRKFFVGLLGSGFRGHKLRLIEANGGGDGGVIVAAARWSAIDGDGAAVGGVAVHEFVRRPDGSLKLRLHTFN